MFDQDGTSMEALALDTTDDFGRFDFGPIYNNTDTDDGNGNKQDIFFTMYADNEAARVFNSSYVIYKNSTAVLTNHPSGVFDTLIQIPQDSSGAFYVADVIYESRNKWLQNRPEDPGKLIVILDNGVGTNFTYGTNTMRIDNSFNYDARYPDTYDRDAILHEYGHKLVESFDFFDSSQGGTHSFNGLYNPELAADEGFAHFWSSFVRGDKNAKNYFNNNTEYKLLNIENGEYGLNGSVIGSANNLGDSCEGAVAGILWDIYDQPNDDYNNDNIGDTLTNGIDNILSTLLDRNVNGHRPDNITEFWDAWFQAPSFGHSQAMSDIWYEHGIITSCCIGIRGNIDGDSQELIDMSDIVYMSDFMLTDGPPPPCNEEANVDGDALEIVDISDFVYLIDFAFSNPAGPPPPSCP